MAHHNAASAHGPAASAHGSAALQPVSLAWHRGDLRTHDHPALAAAAASGAAVGLVIFDTDILDSTSLRRRSWFYANARALRASYARRGGRLFVRTGHAPEVLQQFYAELLAAGHVIRTVHALRSYSPGGIARDAASERALPVPFTWHDGLYVHAPGSIRARSGDGFLVHGPYLRAWRSAGEPEDIDSPAVIPSPVALDAADGDIPEVVSDIDLPAAGEDAALAALVRFADTRLASYAARRDRLDGAGSARLSPWITCGVLSARTAAAVAWQRGGPGADKWTAEISWRDFLADLLYRRPSLVHEPFSQRWEAFEWRDDAAALDAWHRGDTGIPVVDAAMRELQATGWISNRARMVAAQFLTKHLRIRWTEGMKIFHQLLLDGDTASNAGNWQWAAGLGIDNAPYFRVFNPVTQGREHDPDGMWLRRWVPECDGNPAPMQHAIVDIARARRDYLADAAATAGAA